MLNKIFYTLVPAFALATGLVVLYAVSAGIGVETVSATFLIGFPILAGIVILKFRPKGTLPTLLKSIVWQVGVIALALLGSFVSGQEGLICIAMAVGPILFGTLLGGVIYVMWLRAKGQKTTVLSFATVPLCAVLVFDMLPTEPQIYTISNAIVINAPSAEVFARLKSIPDIAPHEIQTRASHLLGIPKPTAAVWEDGPNGAVRHSYWSDDVHFHEIITDVVPNERIAWNFAFPDGWVAEGIEDPHITVGGDYFDVLSGEYHLEDIGGQTKLTLITRTYDNSGLGPYAAFWHRFFFEDFHEVILHLVKTRTEAQLKI